jgi:hypothetical protein
MPASERRHTPRTTMERLACLQIEPDNGAIILNLSNDGLCFHSIAPIEPKGTIRFSFLEQNRRIDAAGELAWTDELQKIAGMRFTTLTGEARQQINTWVAHPSAPSGNGKAQGTSTLGAALLRAFPDIASIRPDAKKNSRRIAESVRSGLTRVRLRIKLSGYSKGLLTGLLVSLVWIFGLFGYEHRRQLGESLISLGQRLASKPEITGQVAEAASQSVSSSPVSSSPQVVEAAHGQGAVQLHTAKHEPVQQPAPPALAASMKPTEVSSPPIKSVPSQSKQPAAQVKSDQPKPSDIKPEPTRPETVVSRAADKPAPQRAPAALSVAPEARRPSAAVAPPPLVANLDSSKFPPVFETATVRPTPAFSQAEAARQMYFDLGRFKDETQARDLSDNLSHRGLRTNVVQKSRLWMNAFEVLVGPYVTEDDASRVHKDLVSYGYNPRPFERGSRNFLFSSKVTLNGTPLPVGDFKIKWESYFADARVQFVQNDAMVTTTRGHWVKRERRFSANEFVYMKNPDGSKTLVEIHFSGLDQALVFRTVS